MKRKSFIIILASLMLIALSVQAFAFSNSPEKTTKAYVKFKIPVALENVENYIDSSKIKAEGFQSISNVGQRQYTGYYLVNKNATLQDAIKDYKNQYYYSLIDGIKVLEQRVETIKDNKLKESAAQVLNDAKARKALFEQSNEIKVDSMIISGEESVLDNFKKKHQSNLTLQIRRDK